MIILLFMLFSFSMLQGMDGDTHHDHDHDSESTSISRRRRTSTSPRAAATTVTTTTSPRRHRHHRHRHQHDYSQRSYSEGDVGDSGGGGASAHAAEARSIRTTPQREMSLVWATEIARLRHLVNQGEARIATLEAERTEHANRIHGLYVHIERLNEQVQRHERTFRGAKQLLLASATSPRSSHYQPASAPGKRR